MLTIVTAVYSPQWKFFPQFIESCLRVIEDHRLIVYNMGLTTKQFEILKGYPVIIEELEYQWGWKSIIIQQVCERWGGKIVWLDPTVIVTKPFEDFITIIEKYGIYAPTDKTTIIKNIVHPSTIKWLKYPFTTEFPMRSTIAFGCDWDKDWVKVFVTEWNKLTLDYKDDAIFTLLYYMYLSKHYFCVIPYYINFKVLD